MPDFKPNSRRAFFLQGSAALGAGAAALAHAGAASGTQQTQSQPGDAAADREAIRLLQQTFMTLIENQDYDAAAQLFEPRARQQFDDEYRRQDGEARHGAYRSGRSRLADSVTVNESRDRATGNFHVEVEWHTPLHEDCTAAQMARLMGQVADRRWEAGRFAAQFVKTEGRWRFSELSYRPA
jgi:SnoaL-like domain